jgi:hypothetical protein
MINLSRENNGIDHGSCIEEDLDVENKNHPFGWIKRLD